MVLPSIIRGWGPGILERVRITVRNDFDSTSNARMLTFDLRCKSAEARQLAGYLIFQINNYETRKRRRQKVAQASF